MSQYRYTKLFNKKLNEFLDNLEDRFPKEKDITVLKSAVEIASATRPEYVVQVYKNFVDPYRKQIENEDEEYFMTEDLGHIINNTDNASEAIKKIDYIKKLLASKQVSKEDKDCIWVSLKLLNKLLDKIIETKEIQF